MVWYSVVPAVSSWQFTIQIVLQVNSGTFEPVMNYQKREIKAITFAIHNKIKGTN